MLQIDSRENRVGIAATAFITQIVPIKPLIFTQAIRLPSGDQAGKASVAGSLVSRWRCGN